MHFKLHISVPGGQDISAEGHGVIALEGEPLFFVFSGLQVMIGAYGQLIANIEINGKRYEAGRLRISPAPIAKPDKLDLAASFPKQFPLQSILPRPHVGQ